MSLMGSFAASAAAQSGRIRFFLLEQYLMKNGTQPARMHELMSKTVLPALNRLHSGPKIVLEALVATHMPQLATIVGFESLDQLWSVHARMGKDDQAVKGLAAAEAGPEPLVEQHSAILLEATDYSPAVEPSKPDAKPRIFELRTYHSPTWRQLKLLHERFAGPEIRIFHRVGVHPILYGSTLIGPNMPNLKYLTPFESLAAREAAWNAFGADPEWIKVRQESIDRGGQISSIIQISLYRAAPYSPVR